MDIVSKILALGMLFLFSAAALFGAVKVDALGHFGGWFFLVAFSLFMCNSIILSLIGAEHTKHK